MRHSGRLIVFSAIAFLVLLAGLAAAEEDFAKLPRYPAPSPDGKTLAFSYQGDIWTVPVEGGRAMRLTVHEAYDYAPVWSPDGSEIAFSSDRFGNDDVYVIPSAGGAAERLTYMSAGDTACGWTPDGGAVIFASNRDWSSHRVPVLY
ncbi:MAG TPA: peptidase S41, partial [Acidobacteriota bacterium]|nr:peptidase S41 [Acidobacteriota bacterium]